MSQSPVQTLEEKINDLLARFDKINFENTQLRGQVGEMRIERDRLNSRNESARKQIDLMISRLKTM